MTRSSNWRRQQLYFGKLKSVECTSQVLFNESNTSSELNPKGVQRSIAVLQRDTEQYSRGGLTGRKHSDDEIGPSTNSEDFTSYSIRGTNFRHIRIETESITTIYNWSIQANMLAVHNCFSISHSKVRGNPNFHKRAIQDKTQGTKLAV
jgi:hypothetical protein